MFYCKTKGKVIEKKFIKKECSDLYKIKFEDKFGREFNFYGNFINGSCKGGNQLSFNVLEKEEFIVNYFSNKIMSSFETKNINKNNIGDCYLKNGLNFYILFFISIVFLISIIFTIFSLRKLKKKS